MIAVVTCQLYQAVGFLSALVLVWLLSLGYLRTKVTAEQRHVN